MHKPHFALISAAYLAPRYDDRAFTSRHLLTSSAIKLSAFAHECALCTSQMMTWCGAFLAPELRFDIPDCLSQSANHTVIPIIRLIQKAVFDADLVGVFPYAADDDALNSVLATGGPQCFPQNGVNGRNSRSAGGRRGEGEKKEYAAKRRFLCGGPGVLSQFHVLITYLILYGPP